MDWHYFGHAMWLADAGGTRVLFDPLLDGVHHGGVFEVEPRRTIDRAALRADFVIVSHQHPDHFDVASLHALAQLDPDTVLLTSDAWVADVARRLGFRTATAVDACARVDLENARLFTTPSHYPDEIEWGALLETREGAVWNQVDSFHPAPSDVRTTLATASRAMGRDYTAGLPLALVRWQPVLETAAPLAEAPGFPFDEYAAALARIAAIDARVVVPSAAGVRHTTPYAWMNHYVYPVPYARVLRDLARRAPSSHALPATIGASYRVRAGVTEFDPRGARDLVSVDDTDLSPSTTLFRPYEIPALRDPNPAHLAEPPMRAVVSRWVHESLAPALARAYPEMRAHAPLRFALETVFPSATDAYTLTVDAHGATVHARLDDDYDVLNSVAGSLLCDVIEGRRSWSDPLLGGMLRGCTRAYALDANGLTAVTVRTAFLQYALPYAESVRRAVEWQVRALVG